jgi:hypothetical protein
VRSRSSVSFTTIFAILTLALAVFWPVVSKLSPIAGALNTPPPKTLTVPHNRVWVNRRSGLYYCHGSAAYGKLVPGTYMDQQEANQVGYSPAANASCQQSPLFGAASPFRQSVFVL